jgi:hypothetical protein
LFCKILARLGNTERRMTDNFKRNNPEQKVLVRDCKTSKRGEKLGIKSKWKDSRKKEETGEVLFIDKYKIEVIL